MIKFHAEEVIARPADEIWTYAADIARHPEWMGVLDARLLSGPQTEVGARGRERMKLGPRQYDVDVEVTTAAPGRQIAWRMAGGSPIVGDVSLDLEPVGPDLTRAVWSGSMRLTGLWRLVEPLIAGEARRGEEAELRRLKEVLEGGVASSALRA